MYLNPHGKNLYLWLKRMFPVLVTLLGSCSADVMRFADGIPQNPGSFQEEESPQRKQLQHKRVSLPNAHEKMAYSAIESFELPPLSLPPSNHRPINRIILPGVGTPPQLLGTFPVDSRVKSTLKMDKGTDQPKIHTVQIGDTLYRISRKNNMSIERLKHENRLSSDVIRVGQVLIIPRKANKLVNDGQTTATFLENPLKKNTKMQKRASILSSPSQGKSVGRDTKLGMDSVKTKLKTGAPIVQFKQAIVSTVESSLVAQKLEEQQITTVMPSTPPVSVSSMQMRWPARGHILSYYGQREGTSTNDGMDIMVPEGTSVKAADGGVVIYADDGLKEFGNTILIRHADNIVTVYGHNSKILVQRGQKVHRGDEIAKSGMSGNAQTPRLHFEVRKNSLPVDPVKYLEN